MNKTILSFILCALTLCVPAKSKDRIIDRPSCLFSQSELIIKKAILTDTATILSFRVDCAFQSWKLTSSVCLQANGKSYAYRAGKLFTQKDGRITEFPFSRDSTNIPVYTVKDNKYIAEKDSLVLCFDPLPSDVSTFDFLEGKERNSWKIYGIRADGKPYPAAFHKQDKMPDVPLPPYTPKAGKAILKGHVYGYDPSIMNVGFGYFGNDYNLTANPFDFSTTVDSLGNFCYEGEIAHPIPFTFLIPGCRLRALLVPGEVNEMDYDVSAYSTIDHLLPRNQTFQFRGKYSALNEVVNDDAFSFYYANRVDYLKSILNMSFDDYVQYGWSKYQNAVKEIVASSKLNTQQKEYLKLKVQAYYLSNRISYLQNIEDGFYYSDIKKDSMNIGKYQTSFTLKDPHASELDIFKDLKALYVIHDCDLLDYMETNNLINNEVYKWMLGLKKAKDLSSQINSLQPVTDPSVWKSIEPQYLPMLQQLNDTIKEKVRLMNKPVASAIKEVPDVPAEELIQTIVNKYKGKVVLIDCWATWCGPCRTGITKMEPVKEELQGKDVVFVYLTNESSNAIEWVKAIEKMKGDHYRILNEKWSKLPNIKAIPHYLLFNKEGKQVLDQVGWNDGLVEEFKNSILKALEE